MRLLVCLCLAIFSAFSSLGGIYLGVKELICASISIARYAQTQGDDSTNKISMRAVQLHPSKTSIRHQPRGVDKPRRNGVDIGLGHLARRGEHDPVNKAIEPAVAHSQRDGAGRYSRREQAAFASGADGLPAWVADLHDGRGPVLLAGSGVLRPEGDELGVGLFAAVGAGQGRVKGGAQVVDVDLYVAFRRQIARDAGEEMGDRRIPVRTAPQSPLPHLS